MRIAALLAAAFALAACQRQPAAPDAAPGGGSVSAAGFTLTSAQTTLPADDLTLPQRPGVALVAANCTSCHSAAMIVTQPPLKAEQWRATVKKMREVYQAPIADADVPGMLRYLTALSAPVAPAAAP